MIKGKKASIQFFKTKELQAKKTQQVQDMNTKVTAPLFYSSAQEGKQFFMPQQKMPLQLGAESFNMSSFYAGQAPSNSPFYSQGINLATNTTKPRQFIVQPKRNKIAGLENRYHDFYMSLNRAEEARCCQDTYSFNNLRFNRLTSSSN